MVAPATELEHLLLEAGNCLLKPPNSPYQLLDLLDKVESVLSRVEQSPSRAVRRALGPSMNALVSGGLLRHQDVDVRVAVAACISEITRITAPDAPYNDQQMKDIFQLIVSSLENISDKSRRSYPKRTTILETVAKVRSCVIMLDLECDGLIVEMFQLFLKAIRDHHPESVFLSMEKIMTVLLEESEDLSELILPILASLKKDNEEVLPISCKLGERVLQNCATKLKPYLVHIFKHMGHSFDDYSKVVASICYGTANSVARHDNNACQVEQVAEVQLIGKSPDETVLVGGVVTDSLSGGNCLDSYGSGVGNGISEIQKETRSLAPESSKPDCTHHADQSVDMNVGCNSEPVCTESGKILVSTSEKTFQERESESCSLVSSKEAPLSSQSEKDKEGEEILERQENHIHEVADSPFEVSDDIHKVAESSNKEKLEIQHSSSKAFECGPMNGAFSPSRDILDNFLVKAGATKIIEHLIEEHEVPSPVVSKKVSEGTNDLEENLLQSREEASNGHNTEKTLLPTLGSETEIGLAGDSDAAPQRNCGKKVFARDSGMGKSSVKKKKGKKKRGRRKACSKNGVAKNLTKEDEREMMASLKSPTALVEDACQLDQTPDINSKREHVPPEDIEMVPSSNSPSILDGDAWQSDQPPKETTMRQHTHGKDSETIPPPDSPSELGGDACQLDQTLKTTSKRKSACGKDSVVVPSPDFPSEFDRDASQLDQTPTTSRRKRLLVKDDVMVPSPDPTSDLDEDACQLDLTPKTTSKRKRMPGKDSASDVIKISNNLIGSKIKVWWPLDKRFYEGVVNSFDPIENKHEVLYTDGDIERINLKRHKWELINLADEEQLTASESPDPSGAMHGKKKAKTDSEASAKQEKMGGSRIARGRGVSSRKWKGSVSRSGSKTKTIRKWGGKTKVFDYGGDMDGFVRRSGRLVVCVSKKGESKTAGATTPKASTNRMTETKTTRSSTSKDTHEKVGNDTPGARDKSKGKASENGDRVNSGRAGREDLAETVITPPLSAEADQPKATGKRSGKKRRRGAKS